MPQRNVSANTAMKTMRNWLFISVSIRLTAEIESDPQKEAPSASADATRSLWAFPRRNMRRFKVGRFYFDLRMIAESEEKIKIIWPSPSTGSAYSAAAL